MFVFLVSLFFPVGLWRLEQDIGLTSANLSVLSECGEGLMDVVCRDACNGHDVPKVTLTNWFTKGHHFHIAIVCFSPV